MKKFKLIVFVCLLGVTLFALMFYKYNKFSTSVNNSPTSVNKTLTPEEISKMYPSDKFPDGEYTSETSQGVTVSEYKDGKLIKRTTNGREVDVKTLKYK